MRKFYKTLLLTPFMLVCASGLTSCNKTTGLTLRILNSEDYIYLGADDGEKDLVDQFVDYIEENYPEYHGVSIVYDTSDTNETIYSEIQTGKSNYDLINVSEYMAQKIVSGGFAQPIDIEGRVPNYGKYASKSIKGRLDQIETTIKVDNPDTGKKEDKVVQLKDYAVGYMWGTLGILFNPSYSDFVNAGYTVEEVITDMMTYDSLWNPKYKNSISVKNSMRDTYAIGVMETYQEEFAELKDKLENGEISTEDYVKAFAKIFNRSDLNNVNEVQATLKALKENVFGLEVDSGKEDIVTQKIGVNLAWSGDATYSMEQAEGYDLDLYYSVPELGSNLWSDVWIMPNNSRTTAQDELAHLFLNYLCDPSIATKNMTYTGYTPFIGGDAILELTRDWYDIRTDEMFVEIENEEGEVEYATIYSVDEVAQEFAAIDYPDFLKAEHDDSRDEHKLRYFLPYVDEKTEEVVEEPEDYDALFDDEHAGPVYLTDDEGEVVTEEVGGEEVPVNKKYGDLTIVDADDSELEEVDLSYFFNETLDEYVDDVDTIFYSDNYLPFTYEDEDGNEQQNISVGQGFFCQFPSEETLNRCAVMEDYGANNEHVMKMWENFKSDPLPTWAIIVFVVFIAGIVGLIGYFAINHYLTKRIRKQRKVNQ